MTAQHVRRSHGVRVLSHIFQKWREIAGSSHGARQYSSVDVVKGKTKVMSIQREREIREVGLGRGGLRKRGCDDMGMKEKGRKRRGGERESRECESGSCLSHNKGAWPVVRQRDETSSCSDGVSEESETQWDQFPDDAHNYYGVCNSDTQSGTLSNSERNGPAA